MSDQSDQEHKAFALLSALADGQATAVEAEQARQAWADSSEARERWHNYHLIGDVLRSEGLAGGSRRDDLAFLETFRERLAQEPVVLAPAALPRDTGQPLRRRQWTGPTAVAAGFVMALGALVTTLNGGPLAPSAPAPAFAQGLDSSAQGRDVAQAWVGPETALAPELRNSLVADSTMVQQADNADPSSFSRHVNEQAVGDLLLVRDAQLDQLLASRHQFSPAHALSLSAGPVRSVGFESAAR